MGHPFQTYRSAAVPESPLLSWLSLSGAFTQPTWQLQLTAFMFCPFLAYNTFVYQPFSKDVVVLFIEPLVGLLAHATWCGVLLHRHKPISACTADT